MRLIRIAPGSFMFLTLYASTSFAQLQRTFASAVGSDGNPCSLSAPCRTLGQAISQATSGGEVIVLDSAGYGPVTINKAISITAPPGVYAGISVFSGDGIDINAGANDVVNLRGLTLNNQGSSGGGIVFNTGGTLRVEGCIVRGFAGGASPGGIAFQSAGSLVVKDTTISDCFFGIKVSPAGGTANVAIDHLMVEGGENGLFIFPSGTGTSLGVIRDSYISSARATGISTGASGGNTALLDVERCVITNNPVGLASSTGSAMSISNCVITHNPGGGFDVMSGATIFTRGNNTIGGNGPNNGSLTPSSAQ